MELRAVVVGSVNVDLVVATSRLPGPGETVLARDVTRLPGGKGANQAVGLARLGASVRMVGAVGDDDLGDWMREALLAEGIRVDGLLALPGVATGLAIVAVAPDGENQILVVPGANAQAPLPAAELFAGAQVVVLQLETPLDVVAEAIRLARLAGVLVVLNAAPARPLTDELLAAVDVLVVNEAEAKVLSPGPGGAAHAALRLLGRGCGAVVVTMGAEGALIARSEDKEGNVRRVAASPVHTVVDTTGAGDCFTAALAFAVASRWDVAESLHFAAAAAGLSVQRQGAQAGLPSLRQVEAVLGT